MSKRTVAAAAAVDPVTAREIGIADIQTAVSCLHALLESVYEVSTEIQYVLPDGSRCHSADRLNGLIILARDEAERIGQSVDLYIGSIGRAATPAVALVAEHPDAELLALGARFDEWNKRYDASLAAWEPLWEEQEARIAEWDRKHPGTDNFRAHQKIRREVELTATVPHTDDLLSEPEADKVMRAIIATPAATVAGLAVKARLAARFTDSMWKKSYKDADWNDLLLRSLVDAVFVAAGQRPPLVAPDSITCPHPRATSG